MQIPQCNFVNGVAFKFTAAITTSGEGAQSQTAPVPGLQMGDLVMLTSSNHANIFPIGANQKIDTAGTLVFGIYFNNDVGEDVEFTGLMFRPENPLEPNVIC